MKIEGLRNAVIKLVTENDGVSLDTIIEYLDFVNKVRYKKAEIMSLLDKLRIEGEVIEKDQLYYYNR